jgi:hypothetical protein
MGGSAANRTVAGPTPATGPRRAGRARQWKARLPQVDEAVELPAIVIDPSGPRGARPNRPPKRDALASTQRVARMTVLERIAYYQGRRDEVPNQQLARALARRKDTAGIREIARNLNNPNRSVQSDCLKVLYEIGYLDPALIADYAGEFLGLLGSKNNRMVWGSMIALGTIAPLRARVIGSRLDEVLAALDRGTVITVVWGVRTLAGVAGASRSDRPRILPHLLRRLETCLPRDVPTHALSCLPAIDDASRDRFRVVLERRRPDLSPSQVARLRKVIREFQVTKGKGADRVARAGSSAARPKVAGNRSPARKQRETPTSPRPAR